MPQPTKLHEQLSWGYKAFSYWCGKSGFGGYLDTFDLDIGGTFTLELILHSRNFVQFV